MDYLDPRKRRSHTRRLFTGYLLMSVVIALGGWLLFNAAFGYGVNPKTGDIIQNSLLFVGSRPGGAEIYIDDKLQDAKTSARFILPSGNYKLTLKKDGYHSWEGNITLDEHTVSRYTYPLLFPVEPKIQPLKTYQSAALFIAQTPDWRRLLVQIPGGRSDRVSFDEYDIGDPSLPPKTLIMPAGILTDPSQSSQLKEIEWASDNNNVLLEHTYSRGKEFIIFNRANPARSINVNKSFDISPTEVALRNQQINQLYIFHRSSGELEIADTTRLALTPLISNVLAFKSSGQNLVSYITQSKSRSNQATAYIWDGTNSYPFHSFRAGSKYILGIEQYQGSWYYVVGSDREKRLNLYKDPLTSLKNPSINDSIPLIALPIQGANQISFSTISRFLAIQAGQKLVVYDLERQSLHSYSLKSSLSEPLRWLDGYRLIGSSQGKVLVLDYDSTNQRQFVSTTSPYGGFFTRDYNYLFTTVKNENGTALVSVDMRAGADLPR